MNAIKVEKYMAVVNGAAPVKEFVNLFVCGEPIHPDDGGDIGLAKGWIQKMIAKGIKLPCGEKLPYKIEK